MKQVTITTQTRGMGAGSTMMKTACDIWKDVSIRTAKSLAVFTLICFLLISEPASSKDWPLPQVQFGYTTMRAKLATDYSVFSGLKKAGIIGEPNDRAGELFMSVGLGKRSFLRLQWNVSGYENWGAQFAGNYYGVNNNWDTNDYAIAEYNLDVPPLQTGIYWHTLVDEVKVDQVVQSVGLSYGRHLVEYGAMSIDGWAGPA
ncbi:MAG: hypothetical protein JNM00_02055, partial [Flavobacteriales bacterium]|nr:hypothetical protein [Flavobacteriales bacterium]